MECGPAPSLRVYACKPTPEATAAILHLFGACADAITVCSDTPPDALTCEVYATETGTCTVEVELEGAPCTQEVLLVEVDQRCGQSIARPEGGSWDTLYFGCEGALSFDCEGNGGGGGT